MKILSALASRNIPPGSSLWHESAHPLRWLLMRLVTLLVGLVGCGAAFARFPEPTPDTEGNRLIQRYWELRTAEVLEKGSLLSIQSAEDWQQQAPQARSELFEMMGLKPLPQKTDLKPIITGTETPEGCVVEKLHFQSRPGLYVTANFYKPAGKIDKPLPTILYVCGHSVMTKDGVSFGNKTGYHHHGLWFARHGYCCLMIDTLQLGEIPGEHHGTFKLNKWWWVARGYTPAGVEAWNCIRALDYLETRPEVDKTRFGVTGRSGGGAYSWWIAALDDRIKAAAPTAGITSMKNHVVDGCVEGHCDCMYFINTFRWDYDKVLALVAPRPLLVCNTDRDSIFPIDGVFDLYQRARRVYGLLGADANIGLHIAEGPHKDTQPLNTGAFHWFERHLKGADIMTTTDAAAKKELEPAALRVFQALPADEHNTKIDHEFVPLAPALKAPSSTGDWQAHKSKLMEALSSQVFRSWPQDKTAPNVTTTTVAEKDGIALSAYDFVSQEPYRLRLYVAHRAGLALKDLELVALNVLDAEGWSDFEATYAQAFPQHFTQAVTQKPDAEALESNQKMFSHFKWGMAYIAPRGVGPTAWSGSDKAQNQRLRRFYLLGETLDSMQAYDIRRAIQSIRQINDLSHTKLWLTASGSMGVNALYASLFEENIARLDIHAPQATHQAGPTYLNVMRFMDIPTAAALAAERAKVILYTQDKTVWQATADTVKALGMENNFQLRAPVPEQK
jgi:hypothetical protein